MKIAVSAESTIDLPKELLTEFDIKTVPFIVSLGNKSGYDGEITAKEIIDYVKKTGILPKTSAVNTFRFGEHFRKLLEDHDAVIHLSLSSKISSACDNAKKAAAELKDVYVIDTRSLSTGIAILAFYTRELIDEGLDPKTIVEKVKARIPKVQIGFVITRLDYLYKGGRCNYLAYLSASLLKIRPRIALENGEMKPKNRYVGKTERCIVKYINDTFLYFNTPVLDKAIITSTTATDEEIATVRKMLTERGFRKIYITYAGATITSHCGENCLGIVYFNDGDENGNYKKEI